MELYGYLKKGNGIDIGILGEDLLLLVGKIDLEDS